MRRMTISKEVSLVPFGHPLYGERVGRLVIGLVGALAILVPGMTAITPTAWALPAACGPSTLPRNDDGSSAAVDLGFSIDFFGATYGQVYVNNNGNVTFDSALPDYTPTDLSGTQRVIIAPFWADVDTRPSNGGSVSYASTTFEGRQAFCVSWIDVGYFANHTDKSNTFQLLIVSRADVLAGAFDIVFNYDRIAWETGDASGGSGGVGGTAARVGYANGTGTAGTFFEQPGSAEPGSFLDNGPRALVNTSGGRLSFPIRRGLPKNDPRNVPSPFILESDWWQWPDADDDGIPDNWERNGVWVNDRFLDLPGLGTKADHKDLFVHLDYTEGRSLDRKVFEYLGESFAASPLSNPDGQDGVALLIDGGSGTPRQGTSPDNWGSLSESRVLQADGLSDPFELTVDNMTYLANQGFASSPRSGGRGVPQLFKYFCECPSFGGDTIGQAWLKSNFGAVSLNGLQANRLLNGLASLRWPGNASNFVRATNIAHELGHTLGLNHHGAEATPANDRRYKSVMSYAYNVYGVDRKIDYSRETVVNLDWQMAEAVGRLTFVHGQFGERPDFYDIGNNLFGAGGEVPVEPSIDELIASVPEADRQAFIDEFGQSALRPVAFTIAGHAGNSALYATGSPNDTGGTTGTLIGVVRGQAVPSTPISEAGLTTIDGQEVLVVRFLVDGQPWELRYRSTFFGLVGTVELCGPPGCETGSGIKFDAAGMPIPGFGLPTTSSTTSTSVVSGPGSTSTTSLGTTSTTAASSTSTTTIPVATTVTTTTVSARCARFERQLDQISDPAARAAALRTLGCPA